jgi:hypothetical protein
MARDSDHRGCEVYILVSCAFTATWLTALDHGVLRYLVFWGRSAMLVYLAGDASLAATCHGDSTLPTELLGD